MKIGMLQMSFQSLGNMMNLPEGHHITAIVPQTAREIASQTFSFIVTGPTLPEHCENSIPIIVQMVRDANGRMWFHEPR